MSNQAEKTKPDTGPQNLQISREGVNWDLYTDPDADALRVRLRVLNAKTRRAFVNSLWQCTTSLLNSEEEHLCFDNFFSYYKDEILIFGSLHS